jgi:hypothetical protein
MPSANSHEGRILTSPITAQGAREGQGGGSKAGFSILECAWGFPARVLSGHILELDARAAYQPRMANDGTKANTFSPAQNTS